MRDVPTKSTTALEAMRWPDGFRCPDYGGGRVIPDAVTEFNIIYIMRTM